MLMEEKKTPFQTTDNETKQADFESRTIKLEVPKALGEESPRRRGRPSKGDGSPPKNRDRVVVGEVEFRKPAADINNLHAAFDRVAEQEKALYARKVELAAQYEKQYSKKLKFVEPVHPLDTKSPCERIPSAQGRALAKGLYAAPAALLGVEARPKDAELDLLGEAIADLSRYHSFADSEFMTWLGVGFAALACFAPAAAELRSKKAGTWEVDKEKLRAAGYLGVAA